MPNSFATVAKNVWCDEALLKFWQRLRNSSHVTRKNLAPDGQNKNVRKGKNTFYNLSFNSKENLHLATARFATVAKKRGHKTPAK